MGWVRRRTGAVCASLVLALCAGVAPTGGVVGGAELRTTGEAPRVPGPHFATTATWRMASFTIRELPASWVPYQRLTPFSTAWPPTADHDADGIPMRWIDGKLQYHPVGLAGLGLIYVSSYWLTDDPVYLDLAGRIAMGLKKIGFTARGGIWFPYRFTFRMHRNPYELMRAPWVSGMAQGQALSLFVRLWKETGDPQYRALADQTFNSLRAIGRRTTPWVSWVDASRYLWIEEYPSSLDHTLNGFIYAIYGLHEYELLTRDETLYTPDRHTRVLELLRGALTTVKAFLPKWRNPGGLSYYCLRHRYRSTKYHDIHVVQLRTLEQMTGDPYFGWMARRFEADA